MNAWIRWFKKQTRAEQSAAATPPGLRIYAIGDIHGRLDLLNRLHDKIREDIAATPDRTPVVVYLGDYVDRGPDSRGVLEVLCGPPVVPGAITIPLRGNHEQVLLDFLEHPRNAADWLAYGGLATLKSYGVRRLDPAIETDLDTMGRGLAAAMPDRHLQLLKTLKTFEVLGDYLFVHAGIRPGIPLARQTADDLLFIREPFLSSPEQHPYVVVHGHQIVDQPEVRPNRIDVDTGAYASGRLTCVVLDGTTRTVMST